MNNLDDDKINKWRSFQPVVRLNRKNICGIREGYFTSFVNVCEIDTNTSFIDYGLIYYLIVLCIHQVYSLF